MSTLFNPKPPQQQAPAPMPDPQNPAVLEASRKAALDITQRAGRSSTILTDATTRGQDTKTDTFAGNKLGAA